MFSLEVLRSSHPVVPPKVVMLDFDGTVGLIREGWHDLIIRYFLDQLTPTPKGQEQSEDDLCHVIKSAVAQNIGKHPMSQFHTLADLVQQYRGTPRDPKACKDEFEKVLSAVVHRRHEQLRGGLDPRELLVPGTLELMQMLRRRRLKLYLVSGTEEEYILEDARLLQITDYFDGGIYGGTKDPAEFSKGKIVQIILNENHITGSELLGFGDGVAETSEVRQVGGFAVGVASDESARQGVDLWKRQQLIEAGADWIIPDFSGIAEIERNLFV